MLFYVYFICVNLCKFVYLLLFVPNWKKTDEKIHKVRQDKFQYQGVDL